MPNLQWSQIPNFLWVLIVLVGAVFGVMLETIWSVSTQVAIHEQRLNDITFKFDDIDDKLDRIYNQLIEWR